METWQKRVLEETHDLAEKIVKLSTYMASDDFDDLDTYSKQLLGAQRIVMGQYHEILRQRIEHFRGTTGNDF